MSEQHGVLVVDKPRGPTSHDVVAGARRLFGTRRVGHAGTLDPMATGVLLLLVGEATKLSPYLTLDRKRYLATIRLGMSTDTLDAEGECVSERPVDPKAVEESALNLALRLERERSEQVPPQFSAIKIGGVPAYRNARRGQAVDFAARPVEVHSLEVMSRTTDELVVELDVSKGYYVRAFCRDLCATLGVEGHLAALRRVASGSFDVTSAHHWPPAAAPSPLPLAEAATRCLPVAHLTETGERRARLGQRLGPEHFEATPTEPGPAAWLSASGRLLAIGAPHPDGGFAVRRGFRPDPDGDA